jgi:hypothetical protein
MATVLHRTTKELKFSADENFHPVSDWIHEPNLSAVSGFASKYWNISGDVVTLMSEAERAAVDASDMGALRDSISEKIESQQSYERAFAEILLDELNMHAARVNAILNAIDNGSSLASIKTAVAAIADVPTRTLAQLRTALRNKLDG